MPSAKDHAVSRWRDSEMVLPVAVMVAIWYCGEMCESESKMLDLSGRGAKERQQGRCGRGRGVPCRYSVHPYNTALSYSPLECGVLRPL